MGSGWSNDDDDTITVPSGATTGPRVVIGAQAEPVLAALGLTAGFLLYWDDDHAYVVAVEEIGGFQGNLRIAAVDDSGASLGTAIDVRYNELGPALQSVTIGEDANVVTLLNDLFTLTATTTELRTNFLDIRTAANTDLRLRMASGAIFRNNPAIVDTVESYHALSLQNGWANAGGAHIAGQYERVASPPNGLWIMGALAAGTKADGTIIANLPANYRPAHTVSIPVAMNPGTAGTSTPMLQLATNGDLTCVGMAAAVAPTIYFSAVVSLDA